MSETASSGLPAIIAGVPAHNNALFHRIRFDAGDPAAFVDHPEHGSVLLIRDIEVERARKQARADRVTHPAEHAPPGGLSGDRETATAQAAAQLCLSLGIAEVRADRTLPLSFHHELTLAGVAVVYDADLGVVDRRRKDDAEIEALAAAQRDTERVIERACATIAGAEADADGTLRWSSSNGESGPLTAERLRGAILADLLALGYESPHGCIVAPGAESGDCHNRGAGVIRTGEPVIIDVFPRSLETRYHGDCTRTVVHGEAPPWLFSMHEAVVEAKAAAFAATHEGATGERVHRAATSVITARGYPTGLPPRAVLDDPSAEYASMPHGTGHGIGLDVHEPPLLDDGGPTLFAGDALTIEPGLYDPHRGGVRVEDMVIVTTTGCTNLNSLHEGLTWS